ncbi:Acetyl-coenzyme A transporter 1 [Armadillidium nasatum]|uniref:Acetyl-coenzyme A transporter 1 n=1 Tax=Armadillidium nasatum TaxID=96803 RepID=A0A5N5SSR1_9CRUS|nr:Acetyl-coenzyme A transporter 1 [Armadillidium nasatum]
MHKRSKSNNINNSFDDGESQKFISDNELKTTSLHRKQDDVGNILLLMLLYILQGIPLGLAGSIPMILQQRNVSYKDQATFSLAFWPFSIKLLWAPIVDSCYWQMMGRRKSWLVPAQFLIGFFLLVLSININYLLENQDGSPHIMILTSVFFALNFLAATQDIAVDGWALTMLSRNNIGWASTCNSVGQTAGYFLGYVVFLALESKDFCVTYLGQEESLVTLPGFFFFWGIIFIVTTSFVWIFKTEKDERQSAGEDELDLVETYKVVGKMLKMPSIQSIILVLLTVKIGFAAVDSLTVLKFTEAGVPKEKLALLSVPLTPLQIFLPLYISKFTAGPRPMDTFLTAFLPRLFFGLVFAALVWFTPLLKGYDGQYHASFYLIVVVVYIVHQVFANCMFVAQMAFYAQVSDPSVGGTYMTLLNTFSNLGGKLAFMGGFAFCFRTYLEDLCSSYLGNTNEV